MNKPDEQTINSWLMGELEGEELRKVEAWAEVHAGDLDTEFQCGIGWDALGAEYMKAVPATEEPPYPEFFNSKLQSAIEAEELDTRESKLDLKTKVEPSIWQKVRWMVMPAAVAAVVAFYAGSQMPSGFSAEGVTQDVVSFKKVYVPDSEVIAAFSETAGGTEIILEGLRPISDELDIAAGETSSSSAASMMVTMPGADGVSDTEDSVITFF